MRIGYNTWSLATVPYQAFIPRLSSIGYSAIAISVIAGYTIGGRFVANACDQAALSADDRKRIKSMLASRGFVLTSVVGNQPLLHADASRVADGLQRLRESVALCTELAQDGQPLPTLNTGMGGVPGQALAPLVDRLGELASFASKSGVVVCVEPHVGQAVDTVERSAWVVEQVASPYLRLDFDVSHFEVQCVPITESVPRLAPLAAAVEIKDQRVFSTRRGGGVEAAAAQGRGGGFEAAAAQERGGGFEAAAAQERGGGVEAAAAQERGGGVEAAAAQGRGGGFDAAAAQERGGGVEASAAQGRGGGFEAAAAQGRGGGVEAGAAQEREGWIEGNGWGEAHGREFQFLLGGEGDFDLPGYLKLMQASGYSDPISFEASVQCQARPGYDGLLEAEKTYRWMADGWRAAGISDQ